MLLLNSSHQDVTPIEANMLVLSREIGKTVVVGDGDQAIHVTVAKLSGHRVTVRLHGKEPNNSATSAVQLFELKLGDKLDLAANAKLTLVDVDRGKVRFGIEAPRSVRIQREEDGKPIRHTGIDALEQPNDEPNESDDGLADSLVPRSPKPILPTLVVRMPEPRSDSDE